MILSLLMPTRNRSRFLPAGVRHFLQTEREDVELIVSDASDDPADAIHYLAPWAHDSRLRLIDNSSKTTGRISSMVENWSRALDVASGKWISIVGDDDIVDSSLIEFIERVEKVAPDVTGVTWHKCSFDLDVHWPREAKIPMGAKIMLAAGRDSVIKQATWPNGKRAPSAIASPYHGCVRRSVLEQIKRDRNGDWFAFRTPDYDLGWSVAWLNKPFIISERPFSIAGVCSASNSYGVRNGVQRAVNLKKWLDESVVVDGWGETNNSFFFTLPMAVLGFRNAFCTQYGLDSRMDLSNFLESLRISLQSQEDQKSFEEHKAAAIFFLANSFNQDFGISALSQRNRPQSHFGGLAGDLLAIPYNVFGGDISEFARIAFGIVRPVSLLFESSVSPRESLE